MKGLEGVGKERGGDVKGLEGVGKEREGLGRNGEWMEWDWKGRG